MIETYNKTRQSLMALLDEEEDEDYTRPTHYAFNLAFDLLDGANAELLVQGTPFPLGSASASEKGGVYIFWERDQTSVQLTVPPKEGGLYYLHVIVRGKSTLLQDVSAGRLAEELTQFAQQNDSKGKISCLPSFSPYIEQPVLLA